MTYLYFFSIFIFLVFSAILCLFILIQEGKGGGLGASFGGDASDSLFGTSTPDVVRKITAWLACIFLVFCIVLSSWTASMGRIQTNTQQVQEIEETP